MTLVMTTKAGLDDRRLLGFQPEVGSVSQHLFGDDLITSTQFSRQVSKTLDRALKRPVTITRSDQAFALLDRNFARQLMAKANETEIIIGLVEAALLLEKGNLAEDHPYGWIRAFDREERDDLYREVISVLRKGSNVDQEDTDTLETVIHEWRESALAILSSAHKEAFTARGTEASVPLTDPSRFGAELNEPRN